MVNSAVKKGLSGNALKYIALAAMTLDHVALAFFGGVAAAYIPMRIVGKLTMPIMCCMLAEGYRYTKSLPKYYLRLFVFAVISIVPYSLVVHDTLFCYTDFNFLFTLILSLAAINVFDKVKNKLPGLFLALIPVAVSYFCDWGITMPKTVLSMIVTMAITMQTNLIRSFLSMLRPPPDGSPVCEWPEYGHWS